jgi:hypothetical protein
VPDDDTVNLMQILSLIEHLRDSCQPPPPSRHDAGTPTIAPTRPAPRLPSRGAGDDDDDDDAGIGTRPAVRGSPVVPSDIIDPTRLSQCGRPQTRRPDAVTVTSLTTAGLIDEHITHLLPRPYSPGMKRGILSTLPTGGGHEEEDPPVSISGER